MKTNTGIDEWIARLYTCPSSSNQKHNGIILSMLKVSGYTRSKPCAYFVILYVYTLMFEMNFIQNRF